MILASILLAAGALPPVIADPRVGPSPWVVVPVGGAAPAAAAGYLVELPAAVDQAWLERLVVLAGGDAPVVVLGTEPPANLAPYFDAVALDRVPDPAALAELRGRLGGLPIVVPATDGAEVVGRLAAGAGAVLVAAPPPTWVAELDGLLPEPLPARGPAGELPTAMRGRDLATVVGLPTGFPGGTVTLPSTWYAGASLLGATSAPVALAAAGETVVATLPALPGGGVLVARRPAEAVENIGVVEVTAEKLPEVGEILARHHRAAARQERTFATWRASQRLLVRVWIAELSRSFEVVLAGPVFFERGVGTDWEIAEAWVDGVRWDADKLPDLPLLEPKRPPVPPLAVRLEPSYAFTLAGVEERSGRRCYALAFDSRTEAGGVRRSGTAWIDAATFGLVELEERAEGLPGEVRSTRATTRYAAREVNGVAVWLPESVTADDLMVAFGGSASIHRELTLTEVEIAPATFAAERAAAWARPNRMNRDTPAGLQELSPDGRGGRVVGAGARPAQRFLLGGIFWDPGLAYPLPYAGLQLQEFRFRGRDDEQFRAFLAGVINDAAWSKRLGRAELTARGFVQLIAFENSVFVAGEEVEGEAIEMSRQRVGLGVATTLGKARVALEGDVVRYDFGRADDTDPDFVMPPDTLEGVLRLEGTVPFGPTTLTLTGEQGHRFDTAPWGIDTSEPATDQWRRWKAVLVYEKAPFPFAKLHLDAQFLGGEDLDRFSAYVPGRFGGLRLRGISSDLLIADRVGAVTASLAVPLTRRIRGELGAGAAWARDRRSGFAAEPLSGIGVGINAPGPWGTLLSASVAYPLTTPGDRGPVVELFVLRPLGRSK
ncbi:MAG: hypothetical protein HY825_15815 [Acidobacteria bacterium]|nr:hypothetical protein [Acidobacteriota bacterium]